MAIEIDKSLIKQRFARSVDTYDVHARVQQYMAKQLLHYILKFEQQFDTVLELGAGTGFCTRELLSQLQIKEIHCNDLVAAYEPKLRSIAHQFNANLEFIETDLEDTSLFKGQYNLIASAATLQWIIKLDELFKGLSMKMKEGAMLAFSSFGSRNLFEVRDVMRSGLFYASLENVAETVEAHFHVKCATEEEQVLYFNEPLDVLKHLKFTGVNALFKTRWTKKDLVAFSELYKQKFSTEKGVSLTYHPMYIIANKK